MCGMWICVKRMEENDNKREGDDDRQKSLLSYKGLVTR